MESVSSAWYIINILRRFHMADDQEFISETVVFKELPKEKRKALQEEYNKTAEGKDMNRILKLFIVIVVAIAIIGYTIEFLTGHVSESISITLFSILALMIRRIKFERWLETEKSIVMKRKRTNG